MTSAAKLDVNGSATMIIWWWLWWWSGQWWWWWWWLWWWSGWWSWWSWWCWPTPVIAIVTARKVSLEAALWNREAKIQLVARLPTFMVSFVLYGQLGDGWQYQNGWTFRKVSNGLWPPLPLPSFLDLIMLHFFYNFMLKSSIYKMCNTNFWTENDPPLATFPKIHLFSCIVTCP